MASNAVLATVWDTCSMRDRDLALAMNLFAFHLIMPLKQLPFNVANAYIQVNNVTNLNAAALIAS
jgi:hypothetical protein